MLVRTGRPIISTIETSTGLPWTETLVRVCPLAIARTDAEGRVWFCNPAFEHTFLYDAAEAAGKTLEELLGLEGGEARRKDGVKVDVETQLLPEIVGDVCVGHFYFFQDVSARRIAERALTRSEEIFANAFRLSPVTITISTAGESRLIEVNDKWIELTGYSRDEAIGRTPLELGLYEDPEDANRVSRLVAASGGSVRNVECRVRTRNGSLLATSVSIAEFTVNDHALRVVVGADLTPLRAAEARLSDVSRKMLDAQELERLRIGRELHDNVGQRLALLNMGLVQTQADVDTLMQAVAGSSDRPLETGGLDFEGRPDNLPRPVFASIETARPRRGAERRLSSSCRDTSRLRSRFPATTCRALCPPMFRSVCFVCCRKG